LTHITARQALHRGFFFRCPSCGQGLLLRGYLTPEKQCSHCHLDFAALRADDGPAWATILVTGHLMVPFMFWVLESGLQSMWLMIAILIALALVMMAVILPRAKGMFMAIIWLTQVQKKAET
jgi:uncharacterized protein (DUF983 family)